MLTASRIGALAPVLAFPLALVACGQDDPAATQPAAHTTVAASTDVGSVQAPPQSPPPGSEEVPPPPEQAEQTPGTVPPQSPAVDVSPEVFDAQQAPLAGGHPAGEEDSAAIRALVAGQYDQTTLRSFFSYVPEHSCTAVRERESSYSPDEAALIPDVPLTDLPAFRDANPSHSVNDIMVDGDRASARVTATSDGETSESVIRFLRENGQWTFCDDQT